jgi:hypothetical protein
VRNPSSPDSGPARREDIQNLMFRWVGYAARELPDNRNDRRAEIVRRIAPLAEAISAVDTAIEADAPIEVVRERCAPAIAGCDALLEWLKASESFDERSALLARVAELRCCLRALSRV